MGLGGERVEAAVDPLAVQVARVDERTLSLTREMGREFASVRAELAQLRSELRLLVGGVYVVVVVGMTALGWLVSRVPH
jgi:hypothetical protein